MCFLFIILSVTSASGAATAMPGTGLAVRAANALLTVFLCPDDIPGRTADNQNQRDNRNYISHRQSPLAGKGIFRFQASFRFRAQCSHDHCHSRNSDQPGHKACAQSAGGDQRADLVYQIADGITNT